MASSPELLAPLDFDDLESPEIPVKYRNKQYVLREASEDTVRRWRNAQTKGASMSGDGKTVVLGDVADSQAVLVGGCLFEVLDPKKNKVSNTSVGDRVILLWPGRVVEKLYDRAMLLSGLKKPETRAELEKQRDDANAKLVALGAGSDEPTDNSDPDEEGSSTSSPSTSSQEDAAGN